MHAPTIFVLALAATAIQFVSAQDPSAQKIGWSGKLSSLDGGLGGTVSVVDSKNLMIKGYTLADASAPALYWWGTTDGVLKDGFRISNKQVKEKASTNSLTIMLDAGKTPADFSTVGLWCERLNANFGQSTLVANTTSTAWTSTAAVSSNAASAAAFPTKTGAASVKTLGWTGGAIGAAVMLATLLL
ncbi:hypothetical protein EJ08DRAFT_648560 [Tothia fuscella]|uniref:DM13 domain-containing protein n=1 Tax=Tothia fuscella TaxID=1048955 RepID=A0A9P4U0H0_9PEZI|nr:hypothetical protein EJ08DRAFT_648560 [Tothia fuscella]